jgi:hypothetical protein
MMDYVAEKKEKKKELPKDCAKKSSARRRAGEDRTSHRHSLSATRLQVEPAKFRRGGWQRCLLFMWRFCWRGEEEEKMETLGGGLQDDDSFGENLPEAKKCPLGVEWKGKGQG